MQDHEAIIVVLGGSNNSNGILSQMSLDRCRHVVNIHRAQPQLRILTTGGWGEHFNESPTAHGELMKQHLIKQGLNASLFLPIAESSYTKADAIEAAKILSDLKLKSILLVTSDFHMERALHYFSLVFPNTKIDPSPAKSSLSPTELQARIDHETNRMRAIRAETRPDLPK